MARNDSIRGSRVQTLPKANKVSPEGRKCLEPSCKTVLSKYNKRDRCWAHAEMKVPRLRGRKPATS